MSNHKIVSPVPILLLGGRSPACLEWVRIFDKSSTTSGLSTSSKLSNQLEQIAPLYEVHVADSVFPCLAGLSNRITACHHLPPPAFAFQDWKNALLDLVANHQIQWIVPTCEEVFYLGKACLEHPSLRQKAWITDFDTLQRLHDKYAFYQLTNQLIQNTHDPANNHINNEITNISTKEEALSSCPSIHTPIQLDIQVPFSITLFLNEQEDIHQKNSNQEDNNQTDDSVEHRQSLWQNLCQLYPSLATSLTTPLTKTTDSNDKDNNRQLLDNTCDSVLKPCLSRFATRTLIRPSLRQTLYALFAQTLSTDNNSSSDMALLSLLKLIKQNKHHQQIKQDDNVTNWLAQQYVQGKEVASYSLAQNGQLIAHTCYQANCRANANGANGMHQQPEQQQSQQTGASLDFQCVAIPQIVDFVQAVIKQCHYTGQIGFDFIQDQQGQWWVLECNPRATSGIHLLADDLVDKKTGKVDTASTIISSVFHSVRNPISQPQMREIIIPYIQLPNGNSIDDVDSNKDNVGKDNVGKDNGSKDNQANHNRLHKALKFAIAYEVLKNPRLFPIAKQTLAHSQDVIFDKQDMRPTVGQFILSLQLLWQAWRHNKSVLAMTTYDIEWNGEAMNNLPQSTSSTISPTLSTPSAPSANR